jgi:hypothetical protein
VFLNTDSMLPAADVIDWKRHCVWIEPASFDQVPTHIRKFHAGHTPASFQELQVANRRIWEQYLEPSAFWHREFAGLVNNNRPVAQRLAE